MQPECFAHCSLLMKTGQGTCSCRSSANFCQTRSDSLWCSNNFSHSHTQFFTLICSEMSHSKNQLPLRRAALLRSSLMWTEPQNTVKKGPDNRESITICLDRSNTNPYDRFGSSYLSSEQFDYWHFFFAAFISFRKLQCLIWLCNHHQQPHIFRVLFFF